MNRGVNKSVGKLDLLYEKEMHKQVIKCKIMYTQDLRKGLSKSRFDINSVLLKIYYFANSIESKQ